MLNIVYIIVILAFILVFISLGIIIHFNRKTLKNTKETLNTLIEMNELEVKVRNQMYEEQKKKEEEE